MGAFGALGGAARAGLAELPSDWPWPTLAVNLVGALLLGFVVRYGPGRWPPWLHVAVGVGALGALTTFSALAATVAGGWAAALAGLRLGAAAQ